MVSLSDRANFTINCGFLIEDIVVEPLKKNPLRGIQLTYQQFHQSVNNWLTLIKSEVLENSSNLILFLIAGSAGLEGGGAD